MWRFLDLLWQDLPSDCSMEAKQDLSVTSSSTDFSSLLIHLPFPIWLSSTSGSTVCRKWGVEWVFSPWCVTQTHHVLFDSSMISASMGHSNSFCGKLWLSCYILCNWFAGQLAHAASEPTELSWAAWHGRCCWVLPSGPDLSLRTQLCTNKYFFTLRQVLLEKMDSVQIYVKP